MGTDPLAVLAVGTDGVDVLDEARRVRLHPGLLGRRLLPVALRGRDLVVERLPAALLRLVVGEGGPEGGRHVAELVQDVHRLVIAEERFHAPAGGACFRLEPHHQVHGVAHAGAPVHDVARLHEHRASAGPAPSLVDQPGRRENRGELLHGAVHVGYRDDS